MLASDDGTAVTDLFHYDAAVVDVNARDLPGIKARFLLRHVPAGGVVLDVGCGGGKMLRTIAEQMPSTTLLGCDRHPPSDTEPGFDFRLADLDDRLPYDDASVDAALLVDVLEHVGRPEWVLDEVARVLSPGGSLLAFVPIEGERRSWYRLFRALLGQDLYVRTKDHVQAFGHSEFESMLGRRFIVSERRYAYHFFGQLMDAGFWAAASIPAVSRRFWAESPYHNAPSASSGSSVAARSFSTLLIAANRIAWLESRVLSRVRASSAGVLIHALRKP